MPPSRSSLVVNHRIAITGTQARATIVGSRLPYIATRPGAVRDIDAAADATRSERDLVSYMDERPGSVSGPGTALFDQGGPVTLADARRGIERAEGAVCCTVISVRRSDAESLRLTTKEDWERFVRANWQREFARMSGIPENRVRFVAAMHANQPNNLHVHILSWDAAKDGAWDSLLGKRPMEDGRRNLTDAALSPERERLGRERSEARDSAVRAMRSLDLMSKREEVGIPVDGSLKFAHLIRFHPEVAARVREVALDARDGDTTIRSECERHERAVTEMGKLKGLEGADLDHYVHEAKADLERRLCNAAVSAMVEDRHARSLGDREGLWTGARREDGEHSRADEPARNDSRSTDVLWEVAPSVARRREQALAQEMSSILNESEKDALLDAASKGEPLPDDAFRRCPTLAHEKRVLAYVPRAAKGKKRSHDTGSDVASDVTRFGMRELAHHLLCQGGRRTNERDAAAERGQEPLREVGADMDR